MGDMNKYVVTKTEIFETTVYAESEEDAEYDAMMKGEFEFVDEEYSVKDAGD